MSQAHTDTPAPGSFPPPSGNLSYYAAAPQRPRDGRFVAMAVSGVLALLLALLAVVLPAPYVIESAGPTLNTLGSEDGKQIISVSGHQSYPATGQLDLVTVYLNGGPQSQVSLFDVYRSWLDPQQAVYPVELIYPPSATKDQINSQNAADMSSSQDLATAAALGQLKIPYRQELFVSSLSDGSPSAGKLQPGDALKTIDGQPIVDQASLQKVLADGQGKAAALGVLRQGAPVTVMITPQKREDRYYLGILLTYKYTFPFDVKISLENIGGPSAGMMFALGIIDTLTPGNLTGGKHFAGTGTIDAAGNVGAIGGIPQKMVGARSAGASVFLAPAANCQEVVGHVPEGLQVVKVSTLKEAYDAVTLVASGKDASGLPTCTAGG
ncbi:PDZ domain-containing protein [Psychromicrobium sp. YIM B11713]|uniref:YlbL family protein n=1 Tax=Psychromicrobium sp. YIM B11713 TaxID=3145233 RepID=UPI00374F65E3